MLDKEQIEEAIAAHSSWKLKLKKAVENGNSEYKVEIVKTDNSCVLGKWLYSLSDSDRNSENWKNVQKLHAEFHTETANILQMALKGLKKEALEALAPGSKFASLSSKLTMAMLSWEKKFS